MYLSVFLYVCVFAYMFVYVCLWVFACDVCVCSGKRNVKLHLF